MFKLSIELYNRCRRILLKCSEFDSNASLKAFFVVAELLPFRDSLPEAASKSERVDACLGFLATKRLNNGHPVLLPFLTALRDRYPVGDGQRDELEALRLEIEKGLVTQTDATLSSAEDHLIGLLRSPDRRQFATYLLSRARLTIIPPIGETSTAIISKVSSIIKGPDNVLNEMETFVLLVAVCLPHLLRAYEDFTEEPISAEQIRQLATRLDQEGDAPEGIGSSLVEIVIELSLIANTWVGFNPESDAYNPSHLHNERIDLRRLGALLHLANRLNLDQFATPEPPPFLSQATEIERFHWWHQAFVRNVSIETQRIQLHIDLPEGYRDLYTPILVDPLDEEIKELIDAYDPILSPVGINPSLRPANVNERAGIPVIPDEEWQRLREKIRIEQARKSKDRLQQDVIRAQSLWELLIKAEVSQAEQMVAEEKYLDGAEAYARAAALLGKAKQASQARSYAIQAAELYLKSNNKLAAAQQYLYAAEVWLYNRSVPELAATQLEQAHKIAVELEDPVLQIRVLHAQAWLAFATLRDPQAQHLWEQINQLILQVTNEAQRLELWRTSALQHAAFAMVWGEEDAAREVLESVLAGCPVTLPGERLALLQGLLLVSTEQGDWETADKIYHEAQQLLSTVEEPQQSGLLAMHYGASLARRGKLQEAYDSYSLAIQQLDGQADAYTLNLAYQNMQYMLQRNGSVLFPDYEQHETRRTDLFYSTQTEAKGYGHEIQAISQLNVGKHRSVMQHIRLALAHYWREGVWAGIEHAYRILAMLHATINKPVKALLAAIRASDLKAIERYTEPLRDTSDTNQLSQVIDTLAKMKPAICEQRVAVKALGILADVVPPTQLAQALDHLLTLLQGPENSNQHVEVRRLSAEAIRFLVAQFDAEQTNKVAQVVYEQLQRQQNWTVIKELLKLLEECFIQRPCQVLQSLYAPVAKTLLNFNEDDHLRILAERIAGELAQTAPPDVRAEVVKRLREHSDQIECLAQLVSLKEPIPEEQLRATIEQILRAINPQPVTTGQAIMIGFGGISPRVLNRFNEVLPASLADQVLDGLLEAIINENNDLSTRSSAIWALSDLPTELLVERADEVVDYLMWGAEEDTLPRSESINRDLESQTNPFSAYRMNTGNIAQVRRSSLHALGRLYTHSNKDKQKRISTHLIAASRDPNPAVRQGVAIALRSIEGSMIQQQRLLLALMVLLHDPDADPCSWACTASAYLINRGLADPFANDFIEQLFNLAETSSVVEIRVGTTVGLQMLAENEQLDETTKHHILEALKKLSKDVSFRVRREATAFNKEKGQ